MGREIIPFPEQGIAIAQCYRCGLFYKTVVPTKDFLLTVFKQQTNVIWSDNYHFQPEKTLIESLVAKPAFDLLDVGPAHGGLLKACQNSAGRRAGLDVVQHTGLKTYLRGEFIQNLLEEPLLIWENRPYDVVTAFDILEHLYDPILAFANLRQLVNKNGFVIIETGDIDSFWAQKFTVQEWWYVNLFEHHLFWSVPTFQSFARQQGFEIIQVTRKRHKNLVCLPLLNLVVATLKEGLYYLSPNVYKKLMRILRKPNRQPFCVFTRDHFRAVLQKIC